MAQLAIVINVSGRVVCERRRCDTKKKAPVASKRMAGAGLDIHAAVLVRRAQRTFDATDNIAQSFMAQVSAFAPCLCGYTRDPAVAVLSTVRPTGVLFLFRAQFRYADHTLKVRTLQIRLHQVAL